ncbi:MAG: DUF6011 domain-containing protein [Negativicutes bacterium]
MTNDPSGVLFPDYDIPHEKIDFPRRDDSSCPRCGRCNRKLKDPESITKGMGRTCYRKDQAYTERFGVSLFSEPAKKPKKKSA